MKWKINNKKANDSRPGSTEVLVCDDDKSISGVIKIMLENNGYDVKTLSSGRAILNLIKNTANYCPDLILLDIWMPGMDGREATKLLKQERKTKKIPIVIISIYVFSSFEEFGEANFDFYYGNIFIVGSSITLTFAIFGARVFRQGVLGKAWLLLVIGIFFTTTGDVWYYYLEVFEEYDLYHPVNVFWYASYWIIVYALIKHKEIF